MPDAEPTDTTIPAAADTGAVRAFGLDLQEGKVIPRRRILAWAFWDWATQPFNTVLLTFVWVPSFLTSYFFLDPEVAASGIGPDGSRIDCDSAANAATAYCGQLGSLATNLGWGITAAGILIALLAPVLGQRRRRRAQEAHARDLHGLLVLTQLGMFFVDGVPAYFWLGSPSSRSAAFAEIANVQLTPSWCRSRRRRPSGASPGSAGASATRRIIASPSSARSWKPARRHGPDDAGSSPWRDHLDARLRHPGFQRARAPPTEDSKRVGFFADTSSSPASRGCGARRGDLLFLLASAVYRDRLSAVFTFGSVIAAHVRLRLHRPRALRHRLNPSPGSDDPVSRLDGLPKPVIRRRRRGSSCAASWCSSSRAGARRCSGPSGSCWRAVKPRRLRRGPRAVTGGARGRCSGCATTGRRRAEWPRRLERASRPSRTRLYGILGIAVVLLVRIAFFVRPPRAPTEALRRDRSPSERARRRDRATPRGLVGRGAPASTKRSRRRQALRLLRGEPGEAALHAAAALARGERGTPRLRQLDDRAARVRRVWPLADHALDPAATSKLARGWSTPTARRAR